LNDAPYSPRHCVAFDEAIESYVDDWEAIPAGHTYDVHAELSMTGRDEVMRTNVVRVVRKPEDPSELAGRDHDGIARASNYDVVGRRDRQ
jgi:hypothetical protein